MAGCEHKTFDCQVTVNRLQDEEGGPVTAWTADVTVTCGDCGRKFAFLGMPGGLHPDRPCVSFDATEARLPLRPAGEGPPARTFPAFSIRPHPGGRR